MYQNMRKLLEEVLTILDRAETRAESTEAKLAAAEAQMETVIRRNIELEKQLQDLRNRERTLTEELIRLQQGNRTS